MGLNSGAYKLLLVLHFVSIIVGFGSFFLASAYGARARARRGREGAAVAEASYEVTVHWAEWFIYAAPVFGILLVLVSDEVWEFSQAWITLSFVVYIAIMGVLHGMYLPNLRRANALMSDLAGGSAGAPMGGAEASGGPEDTALGRGGGAGRPPQVDELDRRSRQVAMASGILNVLVVLILLLMVWKPGQN